MFFAGESDGFTKKENILSQLETEYAVFVKVLGINAPHVVSKVRFDNVA